MRIFVKSAGIVKCSTPGDYDVAVNTAPRNDALLQRGRSMIEMLGVLAIIGVLSVGGIMGYSKAMFRYKINKTIEQITYIAGNIRTTFSNQGNYEGVTGYCPNNNCIAKKAHIFPEDMWKEGYDIPQNVWEGDVNIYPERKNGADSNYIKAFMVENQEIPEEACIELLTHDWNSLGNVMAGVLYGPDYYIMTPANINDAIALCEFMIEVETSLEFFFDVDTSDSYWKHYLDETAAALSGS